MQKGLLKSAIFVILLSGASFSFGDNFTWTFYTADGMSDLNLVATNNHNGTYTVTGASGVIWGSSSSNSNIPEALDVSGVSSYSGSDNLLYYPASGPYYGPFYPGSEPVDGSGMSFATQIAPVQLYTSQGFGYIANYEGAVFFGHGYWGQSTVTKNATPEPAPAFALSMGLIGLCTLRRKRASRRAP